VSRGNKQTNIPSTLRNDAVYHEVELLQWSESLWGQDATFPRSMMYPNSFTWVL
ncbi:hypothetical protein Tsp_07255, partial [Trichinella spiralis]|uniref:hypothetical protein n=1 Tax=Trichinella spiralis TaxID=6334 RepID=UPI0001EFC32B